MSVFVICGKPTLFPITSKNPLLFGEVVPTVNGYVYKVASCPSTTQIAYAWLE